MSEWFVAKEDGSIEGPISFDTLQARHFAGFITDETFVSRDNKVFLPYKELNDRGTESEAKAHTSASESNNQPVATYDEELQCPLVLDDIQEDEMKELGSGPETPLVTGTSARNSCGTPAQPVFPDERRPLILKGEQGKSVLVHGNNVRILKKARVFSAEREKTLPIRNISSVEVKKPGLTSGFIQFSIAGGIARDSSLTVTGGAWDALYDENSVVFTGDENYQIAMRIKEFIESESASVSNSTHVAGISAADEIMKLKGLLDAGILTHAEFEAKKKQLLGL